MLIVILLVAAVVLGCLLPRWRTPRACLIETVMLATLHGVSTSGLLERHMRLPQVSVAFILVAYVFSRFQATYRQSAYPRTRARGFFWERSPVAKATTDTGSPKTEVRATQTVAEIPCTYLLTLAAFSLAVLAGFRDNSSAMPGSTAVSGWVGAVVTLHSWRSGMAMLIVVLAFGARSVMHLPDENLMNELIKLCQ